MTAQNVPASVHQRLLNKARETDRPFNELLQYYAMERFLYRLSNSPHSEKFILKGALMLTVWEAPIGRPTMDIDMLGQTENSVEGVVSLVQDVCNQEVEPDGTVFDPDSVFGERIREDADYEGVRVRFRGYLGNARIAMQLDVGFGDVVVPSAHTTEYPTILEFPAPEIRGYSRESVVAEKFEAMVKLGLLNSRMRDFYDIWLLSRQFDFEGMVLADAIRSTFAARKTEVSADPTAFSEEFANDETKSTQWLAFLRKNRIPEAPENFKEVVAIVADFLVPAAESLVKDLQFDSIWKAPGPWQPVS
jgi:hypothetical protein